jgi:hypothetical protein
MSYQPPSDPQPQPYWQPPTGPSEPYQPPAAPYPGQQLPPPAALCAKIMRGKIYS